MTHVQNFGVCSGRQTCASFFRSKFWTYRNNRVLALIVTGHWIHIIPDWNQNLHTKNRLNSLVPESFICCCSQLQPGAPAEKHARRTRLFQLYSKQCFTFYSNILHFITHLLSYCCCMKKNLYVYLSYLWSRLPGGLVWSSLQLQHHWRQERMLPVWYEPEKSPKQKVSTPLLLKVAANTAATKGTEFDVVWAVSLRIRWRFCAEDKI